MLRRVVGLAAGAATIAILGHRFVYEPWRRRWYAGPDESSRPLPGDELVPDAEFDQTMAVTIGAPPSSVWPWLLQMGYGRGGWYSYDAIDMLGHSVRDLRPDLQDLHAGDMMPFAPNIGFRVDVLQPERALVLYADDKLAGPHEARTTEDPDGAGETAGMRMTGVLASANMTEFAVSWAFALDPLEGGRTRLLERFRTRSTPGPAAAIVGPVIDHGHFLMTRKHMLGLKARAERMGPAHGAGLARTEPGPAA
jgi:hypothetical protein